jgi:zinc protease
MQLDDLLEAKAAHIETGGGDDSTSLSWDSLKGDADQVFTLALDLLLHPDFKPEKLQLAQQQVATGIVRRNDDESWNRRIVNRRSWFTAPIAPTRATGAGHHWQCNGGGFEGLARPDDWRKADCGISGDFDPVAMEAKLRAAFEGLPPVKPEPPRHDAFPGPKQGLSFINKEDVNQSDVQIMGLGIDRHNPDVPALVVMDEILGSGFASRLFQKVRTELGLAYEVGGGFSFAYDHPAVFRVVVLTKSATTVEATKAAMGEIAGFEFPSLHPGGTRPRKGQPSHLVPVPVRHSGEGTCGKRAAGVLRLSGQLS